MRYDSPVKIIPISWAARLAWGLLLLALSGRSAQASVIAEHNWDSGPEPWTTEFGYADLNPGNTGGNPDGWMSITFPVTTEPEIDEIEWSDIVYVNVSDFFVGNWTPNSTIAFDFFASNALPQDVQLQFGSTNGNVWGYNFTGNITQTQTWTTVEVGMNYGTWWGPLPGFDDTEEQFLSDLSAIDWIGVYFFRDTSDEEMYGLDNFRLLVPEPGEWALLAAVLVGGLQRRRKTSAATVTAAGGPTPPSAG